MIGSTSFMLAWARPFKNRKRLFKRPRQRHVGWRRLRFALLIVVCLLLVAYAGIQTPWAKGMLTAYLNRSLAHSGHTLRFTGLSGWLPQHPKLQALTFSDSQGPWLQLEDLELHWQPSSWLHGDVVIKSLSVKRLQILRRPEQKHEKTVTTPSNSREIPTLPGVTIQSFALYHLDISTALLGFPYQGALSGSGRLSPNLEAFTGTVDLSGDMNAQVETTVTTSGKPTQGSITINLTTLQGQGVYQCKYHLSPQELTLSEVNFVAPGAQLQGKATLCRPSYLVEGNLQSRIEDAELLSQWLGQNASGRLLAQAQFSIENNTQQIRAHGEFTQFNWSNLQLDTAKIVLDLEDPWGAMRGHGTLTAMGAQKEPFTLDTQATWQAVSPGWNILLGSTQGQYGDHQIAIQPGAKLAIMGQTAKLHDWDLKVNDRSLTLAGSLEITRAESHTHGTLQIRGYLEADVEWKASLPRKDHEAQFAVTVTRHDTTVQGTSTYLWSDNALAFSNLHISATGLDLKGHAQVQLDTGLLQGQLKADIPDTQALTTFLGYPVEAHAQAQLDFHTDQGTQQLLGQWAVEDVNSIPLRLTSLQGRFNLQEPWSTPIGDIDLQMAGLTWKHLQWDHGAIQVRSDQAGLELSILGAGTLDQPFALDAHSSTRWQDAEQTFVLHEGLLQYGDEILVLQRPALLRRDPGEPNRPACYTLDGWQWQALDAVFILEGWFSSDQLAIQASLNKIDLAKLPSLAQEVSGELNMSLEIQGSPPNPCIDVTAQTQSLSLRKNNTSLDSTLTARLSKQDLSANLILTSSDGNRLQTSIDLPVHFSLWPPQWSHNRSELIATIDMDTDVGILNALPILREAVMEGRVVADLTYQGSLENGDLQGQAQWINGYFEDILLGTIIQDVQATLVAQGDRLVLNEVVATAGEYGRIVAQGTLRLAPELSYALQIEASRFPWVQRADLSAVASGKLNLTGTLRRLILEGGLILDHGLLDLSALPPVLPPTLASTTYTPVTTTVSPSENFTVQGNLKLDLHGGFRIYGAGLDSIWQGQLDLSRIDNHWNVTGSVSPRRGEFRLLSRPFRLTEGSILLDGSWPIMPILDLTAVHRRRGIEARVHLSGRMDQPVIHMESDPPLPEDAILATVLFGRDLDTITAMQALQLAAAVRSLNSPGAGMDVFQRTRQAVGVDTIEFRQAENQPDGSSVAVGKYLAPEVYVEVQQPLSRGGATSTHIEYEIRPNLTLETDAGSGIRPGIGINWKKDY